VPIQWDGSQAGLPTGYTDTLRRAVEGHEAGRRPDTLVICGGIVRPDRTGQGLAAYLLTALRGLAPRAGCERILAPVRPTLKPASCTSTSGDRGTYTKPNVWVRHQ
jgi:GNAT superfamily N-acetyltransferase